MKTCNKCNIPKELSEYHKNKKAKDGLQAKCKLCIKVYTDKYVKENIERIKEYRSRPEVIEAKKIKRSTAHGKISTNRANRNSRNRYKNAAKAQNKFNHAINSGKILRPIFCDNCPSSVNVQGHHDDYNKPLEVRWLCGKCHRIWHESNTPLNR